MHVALNVAVALLGVGVTFAWLARLADARAGIYGAMALSTMPLFFAQALRGGTAPMSAMSAAFGGIAAVVFVDSSRLASAAWAAMAIAGLAAGFLTTGALLGVAVPCLGVGVAWLLTSRDRARLRGGACLVMGIGAAIYGARLAMTHTPLFDRVIAHVGHALLPWSAFLPFALSRMVTAEAPKDEARLRIAIVTTAAIALVAHTVMAHVEFVPFAAPALLAGACALALRDLERGALPSLAMGVGTLLVAFVLGHDLRALPEKGFEAIGASASAFPQSLKDDAALLWGVAVAMFALCVMVAWGEREGERISFEKARYTRWMHTARHAGGGRLASTYAALLASATVLALALFFGRHTRWAASIPRFVRTAGLNAWWLIALAPPVAVAGVQGAMDAVAWVSRRTRVHRAALVLVGAVAASFVLGVGYYPALAKQISPTSAFDAYAKVRAPGDALATFALSDHAPQATPMHDAPSAIAWLTAPSPGRHFLAAGASELARLNAIHREKTGRNVLILDATERTILAASALAPGESSVNPIDRIFADGTPSPRHRLDVNLDDRLTILGYDVVDARGANADALVPGRPAHVRTYYRVLAPIASDYTVFVHIDGAGRRHNGDHPIAHGAYPTTLWHAGDVVVDDTEVVLEPNFTPGLYHFYFGLYLGGGSGARMHVKSGPSDGDNRVNGGTLRVE